MGYRTTPLLLATFITALCGAIAIAAYWSLVSFDEVENALLTDLEFGENNFSFRRADNSCFGNATLTLSEQDNTLHVKARGWLSLKFGDHQEIPTLDAEIGINPLGQMGASFGELTFAHSTVKIGTYNINPITVAIITNEHGEEKKIEQKIPGPFEIKRGRTGKYFLTGPAVTRALSSTDATGFSLTTLPFTPPKVVRGTSAACNQSDSVPFDVTSLSSFVSKFQNQLTNSISKFLP